MSIKSKFTTEVISNILSFFSLKLLLSKNNLGVKEFRIA